MVNINTKNNNSENLDPNPIFEGRVDILDKFILFNKFYLQFIDPKLLIGTILVVIGLQKRALLKQMLRNCASYSKQHLNREQRRKLISRTKYYFQQYRSIDSFKNYHGELLLHLKNSLAFLPYKQFVTMLVSLILGYFIGCLIITIRTKFALKILNDAVTQLHDLTVSRTKNALPHNFLNRIEMKAKTKVFSSSNYLNYKKVSYSKDFLTKMLLDFQKDEDRVTTSRDFLIGNYYFDLTTGESFIGSKRGQLLNMMEGMAENLQIDWNGVEFTEIQPE